MQIQRLYIKHYNNLKNFTFEPNQTEPTTVVLGRNGAGKSNLIEAIVEIFRDLENREPSSFYYELEYTCYQKDIKVICNPDKKNNKLDTYVSKAKLTKEQFLGMKDEILPKHVFAYYSGWNKRLEKLFDKPANSLYNAWKSGSASDNIPLRRMFYCRKDYSQLVLLAFFLLDENKEVKDFLRDYLNIDDLVSALFVMQRPFWRDNKSVSENDRMEGDPKFWFAKGAFLNFLDRLWRHALAPIRSEETKTVDFRERKKDSEHVYLYIKNKDVLKEMKYPGEDETHFFAHLEGLYLCDLLDEVRVTVKHTKAGKIRFDSLSEGEQQLLTVLGLLHFTKDEESLFLLDEPDTHLNPSWTYDYLSLITKQVSGKNSQLLIASHNPLMIASLRKEQVRLLEKVDADDDYKITANQPEEDPIGMGVDGLLQSEIYGMRTVLAPEIIDKIDARQKLLAMHRQTSKVKKDIENLSDELAELGISLSHPNPYFDRFAKALSRNELFHKPKLDKSEIKSLEDFTDDLLKNIISEEDK